MLRKSPMTGCRLLVYCLPRILVNILRKFYQSFKSIHVIIILMIKIYRLKAVLLLVLTVMAIIPVRAQKWSGDGNSYYEVEENEIVKYTLPANTQQIFVSKQQLTPAGQTNPLRIANYSFSADGKKVLIFTNNKKVWRIKTRGDYWVLNLADNSLKKIGTGRPESSLMFAQFSPDGNKVAYVSEYNVYVEDLATFAAKALTTDGNRKFINGTFDWVYEEEFACRDGIRWSPDSKSIAYWQLDASGTKDYYMINNTDNIYPTVIP